MSQVEKFLPSQLIREILDFNIPFETETRKFQAFIVRDNPTTLPYMATQDGNGLQRHMIYVRRNASSTQASYEDVQHLLQRALDAKLQAKPAIDLERELAELKVLMTSRNRRHDIFNSLDALFYSATKDFDSFVSSLAEEETNRANNIKLESLRRPWRLRTA